MIKSKLQKTPNSCDKNFIIKTTKQQYCQIDFDLNCETQYSILRDN